MAPKIPTEFSPTTTLTLSSGYKIPHIFFGVWELYGAECQRSVEAALEAGFRAVDSAEWYENEAECGAGIRNFLCAHPELSREDVFFTTKLKTNVGYDATRTAIKESLEKSGLGYLDMYLLHSPYEGPEVRRECWRAVCDAVKEGEARTGGVSNFGIRHLRELQEAGLMRPAVNQVEVNPFNSQEKIIEYCKEHGILIQAYSPLAKGWRMKTPTLLDVAEKVRCTPGQCLIRWSLQKGYIPLPKSGTPERIRENLQLGFLIPEEEMKRLDACNEGLVTDWDPTDCP